MTLLNSLLLESSNSVISSLSGSSRIIFASSAFFYSIFAWYASIDVTHGFTYVLLNIFRPLSNLTTAVSLSTDTNMNGTSQHFDFALNKSTAAPARRSRNRSDTSCAFGPDGWLRANAMPLLACSVLLTQRASSMEIDVANETGRGMIVQGVGARQIPGA